MVTVLLFHFFHNIRFTNKEQIYKCFKNYFIFWIDHFSDLPIFFSLHPEAYKYLDKYNKHKQELAERLFALFNREVFSDQLPQDTEIFWSGRLVKTAGRCHMKSKAVNGITFSRWVGG
jgi:hypothetical protein